MVPDKDTIQLLTISISTKSVSAKQLMDKYRDDESWVAQKKFEFYYGQLLAFGEILTMLKNMLDNESEDKDSEVSMQSK